MSYPRVKNPVHKGANMNVFCAQIHFQSLRVRANLLRISKLQSLARDLYKY